MLLFIVSFRHYSPGGSESGIYGLFQAASEADLLVKIQKIGLCNISEKDGAGRRFCEVDPYRSLEDDNQDTESVLNRAKQLGLQIQKPRNSDAGPRIKGTYSELVMAFQGNCFDPPDEPYYGPTRFWYKQVEPAQETGVLAFPFGGRFFPASERA